MAEASQTGGQFELPIRVYIEDTDAGGIIFHAKYLHYMERARTEWVRSRGVELRAGLAENISYVVQSLSISYCRPGRLDDLLQVSADLVQCGRVWMEFEQKVVRVSDNALLAAARIRVACIALDTGRPRRLPASISALMAAASNNQPE
ncbi:tol-pal system-associated acyl-CoA thioesterase [Marinobacter sp.]|uniref:tol-pal system-associated acyl-CoA thioesterase n=1 Tax=Marinobacter sp. TaxID=50741 RepID=UPI0038516637